MTYKDFDVDKKKFKDDDIANPCGLMARFFPRDEFLQLKSLDPNDELNVKSYKIEVRKELADPFFSKQFIKSDKEEQWVDVEDPRFINWMVC